MKRIEFLKSLLCLPLIPIIGPLNILKEKVPKTEKLDLIEDKTFDVAKGNANNLLVSSFNEYNSFSFNDNNVMSFCVMSFCIDKNLQWQSANIICPKESAKLMSSYFWFSKFDGRKEFLVDIFSMHSENKKADIKLFNKEVYLSYDPSNQLKNYEVHFNYEPTQNTLDFFTQFSAEIHKKTYGNNDYEIIYSYKNQKGEHVADIIYGKENL